MISSVKPGGTGVGPLAARGKPIFSSGTTARIWTASVRRASSGRAVPEIVISRASIGGFAKRCRRMKRPAIDPSPPNRRSASR